MIDENILFGSYHVVVALENGFKLQKEGHFDILLTYDGGKPRAFHPVSSRACQQHL